MNASRRPIRLSALQGLRAFAALMVVVDHSLLNLVDRGLIWDGAQPVANRLGAAGVFIFFVISGFIMAFTSEHGTGVKGAGLFIARRVWRIVPLYWLATLVYAARLVAGGTAPGGGDILRSLLLIPYFDAVLLYHPVLGPGWTLNFEMYFYLLFGASLILPRTWGLSAIYLLFGGSVFVGALGGWNDGLSGVFAKFLTDPIILYFLLGIAIHLALGKMAVGRAGRKWSVVAGLSGLAGLALLISPSTSEWVFGVGMYAIAPALVAVAITWQPWRETPPARLVVLLGDASYSIYLTHSFVVGPLASAAAAIGLASAALPFVAIAVLLCSILGVACYLFIEKSMLALLRPIFVPSSVTKLA